MRWWKGLCCELEAGDDRTQTGHTHTTATLLQYPSSFVKNSFSMFSWKLGTQQNLSNVGSCVISREPVTCWGVWLVCQLCVAVAQWCQGGGVDRNLSEASLEVWKQHRLFMRRLFRVHSCNLFGKYYGPANISNSITSVSLLCWLSFSQRTELVPSLHACCRCLFHFWQINRDSAAARQKNLLLPPESHHRVGWAEWS